MLQPDVPDPTSAARPIESLDLESIVDEQWMAWYLLTPMERWNAAQALWQDYLAMGGSLDPEIDSQSPFFDIDDLDDRSGTTASDGKPNP
jgi:hypothetical protein